MNKLLIIVAVIFVLYLILCLGVYMFQHKFIFYPQKGSQPPPDDLNIKELLITTADGEKLHAWWMPMDTAAYTVLFFHGNAGNVSRGEKRMRLLHEMGFNALAIDYRGYGISSGSIKQESDIYEDARASYEYLQKTLGINESRIIIWGWSLGGAVAVNLAQHKKCHALVMESTFYGMKDMADRRFWFMPNRFTLKYSFASGEKLSEVACPVLFIHSQHDETIPYAQGEKLFAACGTNKKFVEIAGDHNHGLFDSQQAFIPQALPFLLAP